MHIILESLTGFVVNIVASLGYFGITIFMTVESSFVPFPSEIIIPPAAYLAQQGEMNIFLVVLFGVIGSVLGALINYFLARTLGRKVIYFLADHNFLKILLINKEKIVKAEQCFLKYGNVSTLIGRFVPAVRQLISIPAGFSKMHLGNFVFYTSLGSFVWVAILAALGYAFGANQEALAGYYREISLFFVVFALVLVIFTIIKRKTKL